MYQATSSALLIGITLCRLMVRQVVEFLIGEQGDYWKHIVRLILQQKAMYPKDLFWILKTDIAWGLQKLGLILEKKNISNFIVSTICHQIVRVFSLPIFRGKNIFRYKNTISIHKTQNFPFTILINLTDKIQLICLAASQKLHSPPTINIVDL